MWKKLLLASAVTGVLAGAAISIDPSTAEAEHSGCSKAAKFKFPDDHRARKEFMHWCKSEWKAYKAAHKA